MEFWQSLALTEMDELIELAKIAEEVGFAGITISDHLATPKEIGTRYPYTEDGKPMWEPDDPFPDPWVLIAAMAQETSRIRFMPFVYVLPMRDPFSVAKLLSSASVLSGERVVLGAGTGWMEEEFALVQREFRRRGRRTDEMFEVIAKLLSGKTVDHEGEFYRFEGLHMSPCPAKPIEVRIGGLGPVSLRRAARHDGWLGLNHTPEEVSDVIRFLDGEREKLGRSDLPFDVMIAHYPSSEAGDAADSGFSGRAEYERYREVGVDSVNVPPWRYRGDGAIRFDEKRRSLEDFAERYIVPLGN
jgi:probable F420-dependent oxidoreductase